ncbi:lysine N(6)-hydroxylase/L-ornithine N(5)-oxygenase family protein [Actinosynnema mirum]|uniref:L-lysine N6-monooxygenase MbtG n=1 Tax=Actinosynnema mirum (strain ATCC 29888 / DSM 43827 / JCM 3225 / NBRC 14064 / NCIMB 13271 / NRRL B-12336 / IMRU 3971 / 101) TaxID=446462 RepID=C6WMR6_ACTMD|nr:SidA/IucD/PvdA family monooxygenase [Actinosynnema mirum]ACU36595.1 L-lysine 6-monooxygenase (NADPH) [Actinosynnema mirum DSM 43827]
MEHQEVELLAIGAGPANLALAVALEELAPEIAANTTIVEQHDTVAWQRGMLLPWSQSQVSFLKDLVTLRNPRSEFSFLNFLHANGRLDEFINLGTFTPYRREISDYLSWVAASLKSVRVLHGRKVVAVEPRAEVGGEVTSWLVRFSDGSTTGARSLVFGTGRDPHVPTEFLGLPQEKVAHSIEFAQRLKQLDPATTKRVVVVGGAQSAAEMFWESHQALPGAEVTMVMRSIGLNGYESSKFTNELFYPSFVDTFNSALPDAREQLLREMHRTNYGGLSPATLENLYRTIYLEKLSGDQRMSVITMVEVADARSEGDEVVLTLVDRKDGSRTELRCDVVLLGTGYSQKMPLVTRNLAASVGADDFTVTRNYRVTLPAHVTARVYLQGVNEATHGIADSLISVLAIRSSEIVADLRADDRPAHTPAQAPAQPPAQAPARTQPELLDVVRS